MAAGVVVVGAGAVEAGAGFVTPTRAGFCDCFEHALNISKSTSITMVAIIAIFCWRDQDESVVPENVLLVFALVADFQIVAISHLLRVQSQKGRAGRGPIKSALIS